ncbi:hypothetical protein ACHAWF_018553 [Thalassiosira exigua]
MVDEAGRCRRHTDGRTSARHTAHPPGTRRRVRSRTSSVNAFVSRPRRACPGRRWVITVGPDGRSIPPDGIPSAKTAGTSQRTTHKATKTDDRSRFVFHTLTLSHFFYRRVKAPHPSAMPSSSSTATVRRRPSHVRLLLLAALLLTAAPNIAASTNLFRGGGGGDDGHSDEPHLSPYDWRTRGRPTDRIIGGDTQAESGRYPYSVSLLRSSHFCGGALIASNAVLTAAHCMDSRSIDEVGVRIGSDSRYSGTRYSIKSGHMHSDYKDSTSEYDMYIIILDGEVDIRTVKPVKVNPSPFWPQPGQSAVTMGWGTTVAGSTSFLPSTLRSVEVDVISNEDCEDAERNGEDYKGMVYDDMVCTSTSGKDACQGDSGGPLVIESSDGDPANDVLFGLVSWGIGCAFLPGVFARTSAGYDWIERVVCEENGGVGGVCGAATPEPSTASPSRTPTRFPTRFPTRSECSWERTCMFALARTGTRDGRGKRVKVGLWRESTFGRSKRTDLGWLDAGCGLPE